MTLLPKTWALLALALMLLGLTLVGGPSTAVSALPRINAIDKAAASRIEITSVMHKLVLEKQGDKHWQITAPIDGEADLGRIQAVLSMFTETIEMDVQVDSGNDKDYGLDASNSIVLEVWTAGDEPTISVIIGHDTVGGSSFLRVSGDESVYRARVGQRTRYGGGPVEWRNRTITDIDPAAMTRIELAPQKGAPIRLVRGASLDDQLPGPWLLDPDPGWDVDPHATQLLASQLGQLRAQGIVESDGFDPPRLVATVETEDGATTSLELGQKQSARTATLAVAGKPDAYQVPAQIAGLLLRPLTDYQDKTLMAFDPTEVETMSLVEGRTRVVLRQDLASRLWQVEQPKNVDTDIKQVVFAARTLGQFRGLDFADVTPEEAGFQQRSTMFLVTFFDGSQAAVEASRKAPPIEGAAYVRRAGDSVVYLVRQETIAQLRAAFGRQ